MKALIWTEENYAFIQSFDIFVNMFCRQDIEVVLPKHVDHPDRTEASEACLDRSFDPTL